MIKDNNVERATDWIFSHMEDDMDVEEQPQHTGAPSVQDGPASMLNNILNSLVRIQLEGFYQPHGIFYCKWTLCMPH